VPITPDNDPANQDAQLLEPLNKLFPSETIEATANDTGFVERERTIDPVAFF
jgi:hypothetical protein